MSELINNLQQIYNAKLSIKAAIGTQSDELADYASYINALKPDGYTYLTENGSYNISAYEYAYVNVSSSIPEGYVLPAGTITCDSNGVNYDVKQYAYAYINVEGGGDYDIEQVAAENHLYENIGNDVLTAIQLDSLVDEEVEIDENDGADVYYYRTDYEPYEEFEITNVSAIFTNQNMQSGDIIGINYNEYAKVAVAWDEQTGNATDYIYAYAYITAMDQSRLTGVGSLLETVNGEGMDINDYLDYFRPLLANVHIDLDPDSDPENGVMIFNITGDLVSLNTDFAANPVIFITDNGYHLINGGTIACVDVEGGGSEPESYTLEGGLFINGQGQYYIADEGDLADYINIIPKEDVTGTWSDKFSYLTVGKDTEITGYNYYNGGAMAIQAESYTQSSSIAYQTARLANIEPYLDKEYYGLGQYYDSAYITVNRSFNYPNGTQLGITREVFGYYLPNSSYTNRYKDLMVDVSYIIPAGEAISDELATAMAFDNTTYALDLQNIRYCEDYMVYDNTYVTATTGIDGGGTYYEIDLTQSGNYDDSSLYNSILSGGAFFADMPDNTGDRDPVVHKLEIPSGAFVFDDTDWVFLSNNEEKTNGLVVFNEDYNNNPTLQIDTSGVWAMDENGYWNTTGVGELIVNGINSLKIRFYVDSSDNTWIYDWLIDVDYEFTPDEGGEEEPEPEE